MYPCYRTSYAETDIHFLSCNKNVRLYRSAEPCHSSKQALCNSLNDLVIQDLLEMEFQVILKGVLKL